MAYVFFPFFSFFFFLVGVGFFFHGLECFLFFYSFGSFFLRIDISFSLLCFVFKAWVRDHGVVFSSRLLFFFPIGLLFSFGGKCFPAWYFDLSLPRNFSTAYVSVPSLLFCILSLGENGWGVVVSYIPWVGVKYKRGQKEGILMCFCK